MVSRSICFGTGDVSNSGSQECQLNTEPLFAHNDLLSLDIKIPPVVCINPEVSPCRILLGKAHLFNNFPWQGLPRSHQRRGLGEQRGLAPGLTCLLCLWGLCPWFGWQGSKVHSLCAFQLCQWPLPAQGLWVLWAVCPRVSSGSRGPDLGSWLCQHCRTHLWLLPELQVGHGSPGQAAAAPG